MAGKPRFLDDPNIKHWLKDHRIGRNGPFQPTRLQTYSDRYWIMPALTKFYKAGLITDLLRVIKPGKEATVYCCQAHPDTGAEYLALKVYSQTMFRRLRGDDQYRANRLTRHSGSQVHRTGVHQSRNRRHIAALQKNPRGRNFQFVDWIKYEFHTHFHLFQAGTHVPRPWAYADNAILMEFIGADTLAAPMLHNVKLEKARAQPLFDRLLHNIGRFLAYDRIHGDLSAYNILYWDNKIQIIDFGRAVDPRHNPGVFPLLHRDIARVHAFFAPYGVAADPHRLARRLWHRYQRGLLPQKLPGRSTPPSVSPHRDNP